MIRKKTYWLMLSLLVAGLLSACSADTDNSAPDKVKGVDDKKTVEVSQQEITFNITGNWNQEASTRMTTIDNDDLKSYDIRVDAYYHETTTPFLSNKKIQYKTGLYNSWKFVDNSGLPESYYWPIEGSVTSGSITVGSIDFVGYVPYSKPSYIGDPTYTYENPSFTCTLPINIGEPNTFDTSNQTSLQEFLYAYSGNRTKTTSNSEILLADGIVPLIFKHPFALVNIYLDKAQRGTTINTVTLSNLSTSGTFTYGSGWGTYGNTANLLITVGKEVPGQINYNSLLGGPYLVLPQALSGSDNLTVNRTYGGDTGNISATIGDTWDAGKIYNYYIYLGEDPNDILINVTIENWVTHDYKIPIDVN